MSPHIIGPVQVQFEYEAMEPDELTIRVGDIIRSCRPTGIGWLEGELNGKVGVFPDNYVVKIGMSVNTYVHACIIVNNFIMLHRNYVVLPIANI